MKKIRKRPKRYKIKKIRGGGNKVSWLYINKKNRLMLGEGIKKQRGGFLAPIAAALAPTAIELVSKLFRWNGMKR